METVAVGSGRDVAGLPLPGPEWSPPPDLVGDERAVRTAFLALTGELCVDAACDPVPVRIAGVVSRTRAAAAWGAQADAELLAAYVWGAAEFAARSGARTAAERREWGAREMLTELALALRLPEGTLARRLARLGRLAAFPRLRDANAAGLVSSWHVDAVLDVFRGVDDPAVLARADEFLAARAARMTAPELRSAARGWRSRNVARTDAQRRRNLADRRVDVTPADDDLCFLTALLPAAQAVAIDRRLDECAAAVAGAGDERTLAQLRADALCDLLLDPGSRRPTTARHGGRSRSGEPSDGSAVVAGGLVAWHGDGSRGDVPSDGSAVGAGGLMVGTGLAAADDGSGDGGSCDGGGPDGEGSCDGSDDGASLGDWMSGATVPGWVFGIRPEVVLTVPVLSLLGHSDEPAELEGFGPIDLDTARMLAATAPSFVRVLTHPETGAVLSVGRDRYRLPEDLKRAVRLRDVTCRFPGCRRRARRCDIDHSRAWAHGGGTDICNLECLCRKHHRLKHEMGWTVTHEPNGALRWRAPTGSTYWTEPGGTWPPRPAPPPPAEVRPDESPPAFAGAGVTSGYPDEPPF